MGLLGDGRLLCPLLLDGQEEGAKLAVDGRGLQLQGYALQVYFWSDTPRLAWEQLISRCSAVRCTHTVPNTCLFSDACSFTVDKPYTINYRPEFLPPPLPTKHV